MLQIWKQNKIKYFLFSILPGLNMKNYNQTGYHTLPQTGPINRSRSQNNYQIQENQFQKRYRNSLFNAHKLDSSRKCSPGGNTIWEREYQSQITSQQNQIQSQRGNCYSTNQYYEDSHLNHQSNNQVGTNIQNSLKYVKQLLYKSELNFRMHRQKSEKQTSSFQKLLQTKDQEIHQLNKQILHLKKISNANKGYTIPDQTSMMQLQNKEQTIKQLQRKVHQFKQQSSFFHQDLQIRNKYIQQIKSKYKLKQGNDIAFRKQLQTQICTLRQENKLLVQKALWTQEIKQQKIREIQKGNQIRKIIQNQLQILRTTLSQAKQNYDKNTFKYTEKIITYQNQFKTLRLRTNQKDMKIQALFSKINCIQSQLDFFKDKFTNLLFQIERQQRQSATMFQQAQLLEQNGHKLYQEIQKIRRREIIELEYQKASKLNFNMFDPKDYSLVLGNAQNRSTSEKQTIFQHFTTENVNKQDQIMMQKGFDFLQKFPSLNVGISTIHNNQ